MKWAPSLNKSLLKNKNELTVKCTTRKVSKNNPIKDMIIFFVMEE
jgi:hypothetical protein